jgi:hypothetical protein
MPWISVTTGPSLTDEAAQELSLNLATTAAAAVDLSPGDVIVLVTRGAAASSPGAVVTVAGRNRGDEPEAALAAAVRAEVGAALAIDPDLVGVARL